MYCLSPAGSDSPLVDEKGSAFARLGVRNAAHYLVRPDGYIGFRIAGHSFTQLNQYLAEWYVPAT